MRDFIDRNGSVDGKRLSDHFSDAPFGWSPDTLRYLAAALLVNGEIKLRISGREIKVNGQQAIEGLRTNNSFKTVGVALRDGQLAPELLARAAGRLTELTGETVIPLEQEISKAAAKSFPQFQQQYGPLVEKLKNLGLPGVDAVRELNKDLAEILETDASDVPQRLGSPESTLYDRLKWAGEVTLALKNGLEATIRELREHWKEIKALPDTGIPGQLTAEVEEALQPIAERLGQDNFYAHTADLNTALTTIKNHARDAAIKMSEAEVLTIHTAQETLQQLYEWAELTHAEQSQTLAQLDALGAPAAHTLQGLKQLLNQQFVIQSQTTALKKQVTELGRQRQLERLKEEQEQAAREGRTRISRSITMMRRVSSTAQLEELIQQLQALKNELAIYGDIEVTIELKD